MTPTVGMTVSPKPLTFGRYTSVTPGKRYTVERIMTAAEWFREPTDGYLVLLTGDTNERHWYSAAQFEPAAAEPVAAAASRQAELDVMQSEPDNGDRFY